MNERGAIDQCEDCDIDTVDGEHVRTLFDHVGDGLEGVFDFAVRVHFVVLFLPINTIPWEYGITSYFFSTTYLFISVSMRQAYFCFPIAASFCPWS